MLTAPFRRGPCSWMLLTNSCPFSANRKLHLIENKQNCIKTNANATAKRKKKIFVYIRACQKKGTSWLFLPRVVFGMFFPRVFLRLPAFQTSTTAETQHPVSCACKDTHTLNLHAFIAMIKHMRK